MTESSLSQPQKGISLDFFARDATTALIIQLASLILSYLVQIFLARWMGKTEYGIYEYVSAWTLLLALPAGLGLPRTALRLISEYKVKQDWGRLQGIIRVSWLLTLLGSLLLASIVVGVVLLLSHYRSFVYATPLLVGIGLLPLHAVGNLLSELSTAMRDITLAYVPTEIIWPILVVCSGFVLFQTNHSLTTLPLISTITLMLLVVVAVQSWLFQKKVNTEVEPATPVYEYREWIGLSLILLVQQAFFVILEQSDILLVGSILGPEEAGIYNASVRTAHWVGIVLVILNTVASPRFAAFYAEGDFQGLQKIVSTVNNWILWPTVAIALCLLVFSQPILSIFGSGFTSASLTLKILVLGRLVNALCGSVTSLMVMTGHQNKSFPVFGWCLVINLILHAIAIPRLGIVGAAIATSFTMMVWNIWLCVLVVRHVGVNPSIFRIFFNRENESTTPTS